MTTSKKMEDDLKNNGRRPQKIKMEDDLKKMEDNFNHNLKINLNWL